MPSVVYNTIDRIVYIYFFHGIIINVFCVFVGGANLGYNLSLKNIVESKYFGRGISLAFVMQGLGSLVGNPLAGTFHICRNVSPG